MIDHVLGRPSTRFRKYQVFAVVCFWLGYLAKGSKHGPPAIRVVSKRLSHRLTLWQSTVMTILILYLSRNFAKLTGLESPEPLANLYSRSYFRATWIATALDAGFWTAMRIRKPWLRELASVVFSAYYLLAAEKADEKVRKVRSALTVDHMRISWEKGVTSPYLSTIVKILRPLRYHMKYRPIKVQISRPAKSAYKTPIDAWVFFNGPLTALTSPRSPHQKIVLDIPGGGFVAMNPRVNDDRLMAWAIILGVPIISLDYKKAPEAPYPYALSECFDAYSAIIGSHGRCAGINSGLADAALHNAKLQVVVSGDSAGGNLATGLTLMILASSENDSLATPLETSEGLPLPIGLILNYPALDMNINSWMSDEQVQLIRDGTGSGSSNDEKHRGRPRTRHDEANEAVLRRKSEDYHRLTPAASRATSPFAPHKRDNEQPSTTKLVKETTGQETKTLRTRLAMSSMISYFNDRILTPEMMRAMIILYIGPYNRPDFSSDYFLSPILAPEHLLARFPKTYFLTGERDPLVDDTVIFAGRLRQAKKRAFQQRQELGLVGEDMEFEDVERQYVQTTLVPGISHGFMQMSGMFPPAWGLIERCAGWIRILYREHSAAAAQTARVTAKGSGARQQNRHHSASVSEDEKPLEMTRVPQALKMTSRKSANEKKKRKGELKAEEAGTVRKGDVKSSNAEDVNQITDGPNSDSPKALPAGNGVGPTEPSSAKPTTTPPTTPADELSSTSFDAITPPARNSSSTERRNENERIKAGFPALPTPTREAQMVRLPSEADLMARRMGGLTGGLMGLGEGTRTP